MANYRNVSMAFWTDSKVVDDFTPEDKYFYLYCLTNPHTTLCGCYEVSIRQIANETGYDNDSVERLLKWLDTAHNVIRYSAATKELLVLNWYRYNWSASEKLDKPLLAEIRKVKCDRFREYLADRYNERETIAAPYEYGVDTRSPEVPTGEVPSGRDGPSAPPLAPPEKKVHRKRGQYGWVKLTDDEYERLTGDLGEAELQRCIAYVDESAQATHNKNKWKDWNLVIRKCSRNGWGLQRYAPQRGTGSGAMEDLQELHRRFSEEE